MAKIVFTDTLGAVDFNNGLTTTALGVASRFSAWTPFQRPIGPAATALGTGARSQFAFRIDYGASFEIRDIPVSSLSDALRLMAHLERGGTVEVQTADAASRTYTTCCLAPGGEVSLAQSNATDLTYSMSLTLINLGAAQMLCDYSNV